jgi:hypothetical protein
MQERLCEYEVDKKKALAYLAHVIDDTYGGITMSNSPMPESVIIDAVDTIFKGRPKKYTGFRTRMEKHEYTVEDDQQAFEQWIEQRERDLNNMED